MTAQVRIEISDEFFQEIDQQLSRLGAIQRQPALQAGIRKGLGVIKQRVRQILPKPGYPGDKPNKKALRDTLQIKVKEYGNDGRYIVGVVGYSWGAGSHGHIVEHGHRIATGGKLQRLKGGHNPLATGRVGGFVPGKFYLERAAQSSKAEFEQAIRDSIEQAIAKAVQG